MLKLTFIRFCSSCRNVLADAAQAGHVVFSAIRHKLTSSAPSSPNRRTKQTIQKEQDAINLQTELLQKTSQKTPLKTRYIASKVTQSAKATTHTEARETKTGNTGSIGAGTKVPKPRKKKNLKLLEEQKRDISSPIIPENIENRPLTTELNSNDAYSAPIKPNSNLTENNVDSVSDNLSRNTTNMKPKEGLKQFYATEKFHADRPSEGPILVPPDFGSAPDVVPSNPQTALKLITEPEDNVQLVQVHYTGHYTTS